MAKRLKIGKKAITSMPIMVKAIDKENYRLTMVASTQDVDRHGDTVMQSGWDLKPYLKNPVILNSHNYYDATEVIARAENTRVEGKGKKAKLIQEWVFAVNENPKAKIIFDLYAGKFLHASSVGFIPRKFAENPDGSRNWYVIEEAELLEVSAVSVPANSAATLAKSLGIDVAKLKEVVHIEDEEDDEDIEDTDLDEEETPEEPENDDSEAEDEETAETTDEDEIEEDEPEIDPEEQLPEVPAETADEKRARLIREKQAIEDELKSIEPAPVKTINKKEMVLKAINNIETDRTTHLRKAHGIIQSMLEERESNLDTPTQEKIAARKVHKAIRNLLKLT
jgi:HK97 family phage prohead protease